MCGIVGLMIKRTSKRSQLGKWITPMIICMGDRGSDSAGLAVFIPIDDPSLKRFSLFSPQSSFNWINLEEALNKETSFKSTVSGLENHGQVISPMSPKDFEKWLNQRFPFIHLLSIGQSIEVYKDMGHPRDIADRYNFEKIDASHCVGHTRMATESAVSPAHAHPFTAGEDFCLVHNGSLSNPWSLRRKLEKKGINFETDNDTEAACRFLEFRMQEGQSIEAALQEAIV